VDRMKPWAAAAVVGVAIGALNLAHYVATFGVAGGDAGFGIFPGGLPVGIVLSIMGRRLSPSIVAMVVVGLGIVAGSALAAWRSGELATAKTWAIALPKRKALQAAVGGLLMGIGIPMAQGCLVRHTLSGAPSFIPGSFLALIGIGVGIWAGVFVMMRTSR